MKMQDKLSLIIFVMRDNPLLDKLSGSVTATSLSKAVPEKITPASSRQPVT